MLSRQASQRTLFPSPSNWNAYRWPMYIKHLYTSIHVHIEDGREAFENYKNERRLFNDALTGPHPPLRSPTGFCNTQLALLWNICDLPRKISGFIKIHTRVLVVAVRKEKTN
jgi:hypothetical protein